MLLSHLVVAIIPVKSLIADLIDVNIHFNSLFFTLIYVVLILRYELFVNYSIYSKWNFGNGIVLSEIWTYTCSFMLIYWMAIAYTQICHSILLLVELGCILKNLFVPNLEMTYNSLQVWTVGLRINGLK